MGRHPLVAALALATSVLPAFAYASRGLHVSAPPPLRRQLRVRGGTSPHAAAAAAAAAAADDDDSDGEPRRLGFIGLGIMGLPMAKKLLEDNNDLVVWNRGAGPSADLLAAAEAAEGGGKVVVASSPKEVIEKCGLTYTMLSDLAASEAVYHAPDGILAGFDAAPNGHAIVDCATLTAEHMKALDVAVRERGGRFLEAPVSGSKVPAEQGALIFLLAGDGELYEDAGVQADLAAMGKASYMLGEVGAGTRMKLVVNMLMGTMMANLAEGLALAGAAGLEQEAVVEILGLGAIANPMYGLKGPKIIKGDHAPNFPLRWAKKDMDFAIELAAELGERVPLAEAATAEMAVAVDQGFGDDDFSAVAKPRIKGRAP